MNINIVYNKNIPDYKEVLATLEDELIKSKVEFKSFELNEIEHFGDLTIAIGGDGTILRTARHYSTSKTPVLGINLGRLGFLSQSGKDEIKNTVENILNKRYQVEERIMLYSGNKVALNDFVIKGCSKTRTSKFYLEINDKFVCDYIADGLIISTPTGSTAYGLSAGGPILYPTLDAIVIVPICPHTLNARPLVIPTNEKIRVNTSESLLSVAIDGYDTTECVDGITIKVTDKKAYLAFTENTDFYSVLRNKLHWCDSTK